MVISGTIYICIIFAIIYLNSQKKKNFFTDIDVCRFLIWVPKLCAKHSWIVPDTEYITNLWIINLKIKC